MLTESQYKELVRYRSGDIVDDGNSNETVRFLLKKKYIIKYHPMLPDGSCSKTVMRSITDPGRDALAEYERAEDEMRKEKAEKAAEKKSEHRFQLFNTLFGVALGSLLTLLVEHHRFLINFFLNFFSQVRLK